MGMPKHALALPLQQADIAWCACRLVNSPPSKTEWPWARCQLDGRDLCMGSISQSSEAAHTPLCMSNSTHALNNFRPTNALTWAVTEPYVLTCCLWMLILPMLQLLWFFITFIHIRQPSTLSQACLLGWRQNYLQRMHNTHNPHLVLGLSSATKCYWGPQFLVEAKCNKEGPNHALLPLKKGKV